MDQNQEQQGAPVTETPVTPEMTPEPSAPEVNATDSSPITAEENGGLGATIGSVIVIVVLILGGFYLWSQKNANIEALLDEPLPESDETLTALQAQSTSDNIESIENDLNATDLENLDAELADIDALLNASL